MFLTGNQLQSPVDDESISPDTCVLGDVDAFIEYVEMGQAWRDWQERLAESEKERESFFRENRRYWRHIVLVPSKLAFPHRLAV